MFESLLRIFALTWKELLAALKDPSGRFSVLVPPMLQCLLYGYVATYDLNNVPYAVLDQDRSAASRALLDTLDGSRVFKRVGELTRQEDVKTYIDSQRALLVIQIDQNFQRRLNANQSADIQVIADGRNSNTAGTAMGYVNLVVDSFNTDWRNTHGQSGVPLRVVNRAWYNPNLETRWNMIPGLIGTLTLLQTLLLTAMSVAREREQGTFDQLLVTPFRPWEIMVGKSLPSMLIGATQASSILVVAQLWFHIPFSGSFVTLYLGLIVFLLAAVGCGLLVSAVVKNMQQAMLFSFILIMPFTLLSGLTTPISGMPRFLQIMTWFNPLRYGIEMSQRVYLEGTGLIRLGPDLLPLAAMAAVTLPIAAWLFRHRLA